MHRLWRVCPKLYGDTEGCGLGLGVTSPVRLLHNYNRCIRFLLSGDMSRRGYLRKRADTGKKLFPVIK
jgi:hypothetical protein